MTKNLLVLILTSTNARLCRRAYNSVTQDQQPHPGLHVTVKVVVNSMTSGYTSAVRQAMPADVEIIETISTGLPGVGHNSCLDYFQQHPEYDYLFHLDGDDVVYDTALRALEMLIECEPAFVGSCGIDRLTNLPNNPQLRGKPLTYGFYRTSANTDEMPDVWQRWPPMNPFSQPVWKTFTPSRPLLFGRAILDAPIPVRWSEKLVKHDDFLVFLTAVENWLRCGVKGIYFSPTTQIYVYNILHPESATKTKKVDPDLQQQHFDADTKDILQLRQPGQWDDVFRSGKLPMLLLPALVKEADDHKTAHLKRHVVHFALKHIEQGQALFDQGRYQDALVWWNRALGEGLFSGPHFLRMGRAHTKLQHNDVAAAFFRKAASLPKTKDEALLALRELQTPTPPSPPSLPPPDLSHVRYVEDICKPIDTTGSPTGDNAG